MRKISLIVIHCSAVTPDQESSAAQIDTWHRQRGWKFGIGYHYVIRGNSASATTTSSVVTERLSQADRNGWSAPTA